MNLVTIRRPESPSYNALVKHDVNSHSKSREDEIRGDSGNGQRLREINSSSEINRLSGELNQRNTQEKWSIYWVAELTNSESDKWSY